MRHSFAYCISRKLRQRIFHCSGGSKSFLTPGTSKLSPCTLRGSVASAAVFVGKPFVLFLKLNTCKHILGFKVADSHIAEKGAVGSAAVTVVAAHAVGHNAAFLRRCHYHLASRTHTESIHAPSVFAAVIKLVIRSRKPQLPGGCPVLSYVYHILRMLDSDSYGKRFLRHIYAFFVHPSESIPCTVANSKDRRFTVQNTAVGKANPQKPICLCPAAIISPAISYFALCYYAIRPAAEPHFTSEALDFFPYIFNYIS